MTRALFETILVAKRFVICLMSATLCCIGAGCDGAPEERDGVSEPRDRFKSSLASQCGLLGSHESLSDGETVTSCDGSTSLYVSNGAAYLYRQGIHVWSLLMPYEPPWLGADLTSLVMGDEGLELWMDISGAGNWQRASRIPASAGS